MDLRSISAAQKKQYNSLITHVVQSWEWGEFREKLGLPLLRYGIYDKNNLITAFQLTLHKIPYTTSFIGYLPKGPWPDEKFAQALGEIGKKHHCAAIKIEPNILNQKLGVGSRKISEKLKKSSKTLFTKHNYLIDLTKSEEELLKNMHPKTRYNIKVAQKHGVTVEERNDEEGLSHHLKLYFQTCRRQKYLGHNQHYHQTLWQVLSKTKMAKILIAYYLPPGSKEKIPLASWMLLSFKDTLYYPYGGSSLEYKNVMASTLLAWEAIKLGKKMKMKTFDLWGALDPDADSNHPWQGFTQFKQRLGASLVEYVGTYDLVFNFPLYFAFTQVDKFTNLKVLLLKLLKS